MKRNINPAPHDILIIESVRSLLPSRIPSAPCAIDFMATNSLTGPRINGQNINKAKVSLAHGLKDKAPLLILAAQNAHIAKIANGPIPIPIPFSIQIILVFVIIRFHVSGPEATPIKKMITATRIMNLVVGGAIMRADGSRLQGTDTLIPFRLY